MAVATNPLQTFLWGDGGTIKTPEQVARDRMIADALLKQGADYSPVQSWTQGAARLADAISSVIHEHRAESEEQAGIANAKSLYGDKIAALLSGAEPAAGVDAAASPVAATANLAAASPGDPSYQNAIASIESAGSGGYGAVGPTNTKLGRPLGKYQVMEANLPAWSKEALGYTVTPDQFLANPQLQDAIFNHQFGKYVSQFGPEGAAQAWFAGPGGVGHGDRADTLGTTVNDYTKRFDDALGSGIPTVAEALTKAPPDADPVVGDRAQQLAEALGGNAAPVSAAAALPAGKLIPLLLQASADPWAQKEYGPVLNALLGEQIKRSDPSYALGNELTRAKIAEALAKAAGNGADSAFGSTVEWTDANNKLHVGQLLKSGGVKEINPGAGMSIVDPLIQVNQGTQTSLIGKNTGTVQSVLPTNNTQASLDKGLGAGVAKDILTLKDDAQSAADLLKVVNQGRAVLDQGAITGAGAGAKVAAIKWAASLGIPVPQDAANNSEAFKAVMGQAVGQIIKQFGSGTGLSDADRQYAQQIVGGNIDLNEAAIRKILDIADKSARARIKAWNDRLPSLKSGDTSALLTVQMPDVYVQPPPANGSGASSPAGAPQPGQVEDGYRFKGGDPADQSNWERVQ